MTRTIAASEERLVTIARALVMPQLIDASAVIAGGRREMPPQISTDCAALLEDALARTWVALWRRHGRRGWERHSHAPLVYTGATIELLRFLAGARTSPL